MRTTTSRAKLTNCNYIIRSPSIETAPPLHQMTQPPGPANHPVHVTSNITIITCHGPINRVERLTPEDQSIGDQHLRLGETERLVGGLAERAVEECAHAALKS